MVELLIRNKDGTAGRKAGDIVSVKQCPHNGWGRGEMTPDYSIIKINDKNYEQIKKYHTRHLATKFDEKGEPVEWIRSNYRIFVDNLSEASKTSIRSDGKCELFFAELNTAIIDRKSELSQSKK